MNFAQKILSAVAVFLRKLTRQQQREQQRQQQRQQQREQKQGERVGIYLGPFTTNVILRPFVSIIIGSAIVSTIYYGLTLLMGDTDIFPWWAAIILGCLLAFSFALNDSEPVTVPKVHVAIVTFLGYRLPIYFVEGTHYWYGRQFGFNRSTDRLPRPTTGKAKDDGKGEEGEEEGFVFVGNRQLEIFARAEQGDKGLVLQNVAGDFSEVFAKLTIVVGTINPRRWANSADPILDTAERARSALRTIVSFFSGVDNAVLKTVFSGLLRGDKLLSAFTSKPVGIHPRGSVIQGRSGWPIFEIVPSDISDEDLETTREGLREKIQREADPDMLLTIRDDEENFIIQVRAVYDHIVPVMDDVGGHFVRATVSDIRLSDPVTTQANVAAGESFERVAQELSAGTIVKVQLMLAEVEGAATPEGERALMAALAKDGHAKIIYVPGSDRLTRAAVAGASQIGG